MNETPSSWLWGGGLLSIGVGFKWLWDKLFARADKRERDLDAREGKLDAKEAEIVKHMEERLGAVEETVKAQGQELENHRIALAILVAKVARDDPHAPELSQVRAILGKAFPLNLHMPPELADALDRLTGER